MRFNKPYTVAELLFTLDYSEGYLQGDSQSVIFGFSDDYFVKENELTWTENKQVLNTLLKKECLTIITNLKCGISNGNINIIACDNPLRMFEAIIDNCFSWPRKTQHIGHNTHIHETAILGDNVHIGDNCHIAPYVVIGDNVVIGNNVEISPFSAIGNNPYYTLWDKKHVLRTRNIYGNVDIGNNVSIGSHCSIDNGITCTTEIGDNSRIGNFVEIGHDVKIGKNCCICAQTAIGGYVSMGNDCVLWGRSGIANRINIASNTTILASSILTKNVLNEGQSYCGFPAVERIKYWRNMVKYNK